MFRTFISSLLVFCHCAFSFAVDYDAIVIGTSPVCLLEALHRHHSGERVLIIEGSSTYGGAWKSISVCGLPHVELGCHLIGNNKNVCDFLVKHVGCQTISMDMPHLPYEENMGSNGFYLAGGCRELINHLTQLVDATDIVVLINEQMESVTLNEQEGFVIAHTKEMNYTASKMIITPYSHIQINNHSTISLDSQFPTKTKHYHLYVLIEDATTPRFTYRNGVGNGSLRIMNLTPFIGLEGSGVQLIVFQVQNTQSLELADLYIDTLKKQNLIDSSAYIHKTDTFIYEQFRLNQALIKQIPNNEHFFDMLYTHKIIDMDRYVPKWKETLPLYKDVVSEQ